MLFRGKRIYNFYKYTHTQPVEHVHTHIIYTSMHQMSRAYTHPIPMNKLEKNGADTHRDLLPSHNASWCQLAQGT